MNRKDFTLIEFLVVAIIAILAVILPPPLHSARERRIFFFDAKLHDSRLFYCEDAGKFQNK